MHALLEAILNDSCLTKTQFYAFIIKKGASTILSEADSSRIEEIKKMPSGEVSAIRAQAKRNIREAIHTIILLYATGAIDEEVLKGTLAMSLEINKLISIAPTLSESELNEVIRTLEETINSMLL